jgi:hypothetical protein
MTKAWKSVIVESPSVRAAEITPDELTSDGTTLHVLSERSAAGAFWGRDARRHAVEWEHGTTQGKGYVEFRPLSSTSSEVVLHLQAPKGLAGRVVWPSRRLAAQAGQLVQTLKREISQDARPARKGAARRTA